MDISDTLGSEAIRQAPRILGLIDREGSSATYGCADRYYWHYKLHDFANARFQEASEVLAAAFQYNHPMNPYHLQDRVREWAIAAIRFWEKIKRCDGSFDEAYPFERSFCSTSFSTMHATQALLLLSARPVTDLRPIGRWLSAHDTADTVNQRAASAAALANLGVLTDHTAFLRAAKDRVSNIRADHERLGYFNEYGGSDLGYSSITLSALSVYADRARDMETIEWVKSIAGKLGQSLREDGTYEYEGQSRSTRFFYPYALARSNDPGLKKISSGVAADKILKPSWMDDRYMIPYAADYLRTAAFRT